MIKKIWIILPVLLLFCTEPIRNYLKIDNTDNKSGNTTRDTGSVSGNVLKTADTAAVPGIYSIAQWSGKVFYVLPKQQMFVNFGYEIYLTRELGSCTDQPDTALELKNHRMRTDKISGHSLICQSVDSMHGEWLLVMFDSLINRTLYILTYKNAVKEIVFQSDLDNARKRWSQKKVYSRRGIISTSDKSGGYGSLRLAIQDSLIVDDVSFGVTPLPVKPLWLIVHTRDARSGFIPIRISWNNMMSDLPRDGRPWDEDILEEDPLVTYNWDSSIWELINNHRVIINMNEDQVLLSWGQPTEKFTRTVNGKSMSCWKYQSQTLCFSDKLVSLILNE